MAFCVTVVRPVPPLVPGNAVVSDSVFAVIATLTVEFAVMTTAEAFEVNAPDLRYVSRIAVV